MKDWTYSEGCGCRVTFIGESKYLTSRMMCCEEHSGRKMFDWRTAFRTRAKRELGAYAREHAREALPLADEKPEPLADRPMLRIAEYGVASWCPTPDGSGPAEAVVFHFQVAGPDDEVVELAMRLKSPRAVNELIAALERHRDDVWPQGVLST